MPRAPPKTPKNNVASKRTKPLHTPVHHPPESPSSSEDTGPNHVEFTPCASQHSYAAKGSVSTKTSTSSSVKIAKNVRNIRDSLGEEGFYFEDEESYEKYPELQQEVERIFCRERGSAMRTESLRAIKQWRKENSTAPEDGYYSKLLPKIVKDSRSTFGDVAAYVTKSFQSDELHEATKAVLNRNILYQHREDIEKKLGLTNPVPDHLWGLKIPHNSPRNAPKLNAAATALIKLGGDVRWAGFAMEDKSADDPIEAAENQAIRSGAALVESRRQLKALARKPGEKEAVGVDVECIAFSCSWVPQLANIHVHWYELTEEGHSIWHMNWLEGYRFSKDADMKQFRHDIHNILDWVCGHERKQKIRELELRLAAS